MVQRNRVGAVEVGDGARHFQDAVVGARRKRQLVDGVFQKLVRAAVELAVRAQVPGSHLRVAGDAVVAEALHLALAATQHPLAHARRAFARLLGHQLLRTEARHFDVDVNAVEQRAGNAHQVAADLLLRALALSPLVAEESARTPVPISVGVV